uniref:Uncharacterized protein n=1 Tax=Parascaris univalens TaxID=6257 RepID=A0A915BSU0_PARUN
MFNQIYPYAYIYMCIFISLYLHLYLYLYWYLYLYRYLYFKGKRRAYKSSFKFRGAQFGKRRSESTIEPLPYDIPLKRARNNKKASLFPIIKISSIYINLTDYIGSAVFVISDVTPIIDNEVCFPLFFPLR